MKAKHILRDRRSILGGAILAGSVLVGAAALPLLAGLPRGLRAEESGKEPLKADARGLLDGDRMLGNREAPAVLIEYASLSCPRCARFHSTMLPSIKRDWVESGKLLYVYRDFPLNRPALWAAMVADCLEGDAFFGFIELLYKEQRSWLMAEDLGAELFMLSQLAGFDRARFESCVSDEATFDRLVMGIEYAEATYGIDATPTLILNDTKVSPASYEELSALIAEEQGR